MFHDNKPPVAYADSLADLIKHGKFLHEFDEVSLYQLASTTRFYRANCYATLLSRYIKNSDYKGVKKILINLYANPMIGMPYCAQLIKALELLPEKITLVTLDRILVLFILMALCQQQKDFQNTEHWKKRFLICLSDYKASLKPTDKFDLEIANSILAHYARLTNNITQFNECFESANCIYERPTSFTEKAYVIDPYPFTLTQPDDALLMLLPYADKVSLTHTVDFLSSVSDEFKWNIILILCILNRFAPAAKKSEARVKLRQCYPAPFEYVLDCNYSSKAELDAELLLTMKPDQVIKTFNQKQANNHPRLWAATVVKFLRNVKFGPEDKDNIYLKNLVRVLPYNAFAATARQDDLVRLLLPLLLSQLFSKLNAQEFEYIFINHLIEPMSRHYSLEYADMLAKLITERATTEIYALFSKSFILPPTYNYFIHTVFARFYAELLKRLDGNLLVQCVNILQKTYVEGKAEHHPYFMMYMEILARLHQAEVCQAKSFSAVLTGRNRPTPQQELLCNGQVTPQKLARIFSDMLPASRTGLLGVYYCLRFENNTDNQNALLSHVQTEFTMRIRHHLRRPNTGDTDTKLAFTLARQLFKLTGAIKNEKLRQKAFSRARKLILCFPARKRNALLLNLCCYDKTKRSKKIENIIQHSILSALCCKYAKDSVSEDTSSDLEAITKHLIRKNDITLIQAYLVKLRDIVEKSKNLTVQTLAATQLGHLYRQYPDLLADSDYEQLFMLDPDKTMCLLQYVKDEERALALLEYYTFGIKVINQNSFNSLCGAVSCSGFNSLKLAFVNWLLELNIYNYDNRVFIKNSVNTIMTSINEPQVINQLYHLLLAHQLSLVSPAKEIFTPIFKSVIRQNIHKIPPELLPEIPEHLGLTDKWLLDEINDEGKQAQVSCPVAH